MLQNQWVINSEIKTIGEIIMEDLKGKQGFNLVKLASGEFAVTLDLVDLNLFSGLYETIWLELADDSLQEYIRQEIVDNNPNLDPDKLDCVETGSVDYMKALKEIATYYIDDLKNYLDDTLVDKATIKDITWYDIFSPYEYNFSTDDIKLIVILNDLNDDTINHINDYIDICNDDFKDLEFDLYDSYSFSEYYENNLINYNDIYAWYDDIDYKVDTSNNYQLIKE